jgi:repressor LexA
VIGRVAAGQPLLAVENRESEVRVDDGLFRPRADYLLRVHGDSMVDAGILDGDLLAVHRAADADDGRIVVARIDGEVTVKRLRRAGAAIRLEAANPDYADIEVADPDSFALEGLAVGVLRNL